MKISYLVESMLKENIFRISNEIKNTKYIPLRRYFVCLFKEKLAK